MAEVVSSTDRVRGVEGKARFLEATEAFVDVHYERLDGRKVTLPCCNVFRVRNGLVAEYRAYLDIGPVYA